jgi:flagella basal body P-ring formation protein FlgA
MAMIGNMIRTLTAAAVLIALAPSVGAQNAPAQPAPKLKELVTVTGDIVRIGDLVDNAGAAANVAVFRAPDLGQTGTVPVGRVADALRPHDITGIDTGGLSEVVVTRLSRAISAKDVEDRIARAVAGQYGFADARDLLVITDRELRTMHVEASAASDLVMSRIYLDQRTGRFDVSFELPGSAVARRLPLRFTGTVRETVETATLTRTLARGDVVRSTDVAMERRPKVEAAGEAISAEQVVGLAAKRAMRAGQVVRAGDLSKPEVVQRDELVTIVYEVPGILLTMRGKVLEAGAVGDLVNVINVQSKRTVQAKVIGPGRVAITSTSPQVAAAVAPATQARARAE